MPAKVRLYIRPSFPDGTRPFLDPIFTTNHKLKSGVAVLHGREQRFEKYTYYLRYLKNGKRVWEPVGGDAAIALVKQRSVANRLEGIALGNIKEDDEPGSKHEAEPRPEPQAEAALEPAS